MPALILVSDDQFNAAEESNFFKPETLISNVSFKSNHHFYNFNLHGSTISNCRFSNTSFHNTVLDNSIISNCIFLDCRFYEASLKYVSFNNVEFINCTFSETDMAGSSEDGYTSFNGCSLIRCRFIKAKGARIEFYRTLLNESGSIESDFTDSSFNKCNLWGVKMMDSIFDDADFSRVNLKGAVFDNCSFYHTRIADGDINDLTKFLNCNMDGIRNKHCWLPQCNKEKTEFTESFINPLQ